MSSNIRVQKICKYCGNEFTARTTVTLYCSEPCNKRDYKARKRNGKIEASNLETTRIKNKSIEDLKTKDFLTVAETSVLLNCSKRSVYYYIKSGIIKATNLGLRITRIKRTDIDKLFDHD